MQQHCSEYGDTCSNVIQQTVDVGLPISIVPSIHLGGISSMCCGEARVEQCNCPGSCCGLELRITQTVSYTIPIEYGIEATAGNVISECKHNNLCGKCKQCRC